LPADLYQARLCGPAFCWLVVTSVWRRPVASSLQWLPVLIVRWLGAAHNLPPPACPVHAAHAHPCFPLLRLFNFTDALFFTMGQQACIQRRYEKVTEAWRGHNAGCSTACTVWQQPSAGAAALLSIGPWPHSKCPPLAAMHRLILLGSALMAASALVSLMHFSRNEHCSSQLMRRGSSSRSSFFCVGQTRPSSSGLRWAVAFGP
jgi:hypothetical protein